MTDVRDPGPEIVDKILDELEECKWSPTDVARQARRLRAHIEALRCPEFAVLVNALAECPLTTETTGVAHDQMGDALVIGARAWRFGDPTGGS
jgi:hypothetical protein